VPQLANQEGENKTKTKPARLWCYGKSPKKNLVASKSYILIALSVRDVTVMLPVLHFLWQNRPLYINCRRVQFRMHPCAERMDGIFEASFRRPLDTEKSDGPSTGRRPRKMYAAVKTAWGFLPLCLSPRSVCRLH
jgi:hypothetical protein